MNKKYSIAYIAIIAALYAALCLVLAPISFGPIQLRLAELLCILAIDFPFALIGVSIGCFLSNMLVGGLGVIDIVFGTLATVIGCLLAYLLRDHRIKGLPVLSAMMIVLANAIIVGGELSFVLNEVKAMPLFMLEVGIGEFIVVGILGMIVYPKLKDLVERLISKA